METGTFWHRWFNQVLIEQGQLVMHETKLNDWLPTGWSGRSDWLVWDTKKRAFSLADLKSAKGEGLKWIKWGGAKDNHIWQLSAYYHALASARFPLLRKFTLIYLPMNDIPREDITPLVVECDPIPKEVIWPIMEDKWQRACQYLESLKNYDGFLTDSLAPPTERIQKLYKNKEKWELKLVPHWLTSYCSYDSSLCDCNEQTTTKIGEFVDGEYIPRKGFGDVKPEKHIYAKGTSSTR